jgi:hypothetical protein
MISKGQCTDIKEVLGTQGTEETEEAGLHRRAKCDRKCWIISQQSIHSWAIANFRDLVIGVLRNKLEKGEVRDRNVRLSLSLSTIF